MSEFGERLTNLRESRGWSKTYVAKAIGLSSMQTYANYEYGRREPDFNTVNKLASLFDVSADYLLGRKSSDDKPLTKTRSWLPTQLTPIFPMKSATTSLKWLKLQ